MIQNIGLSQVQTGMVAINNTAHNIANGNNTNAKEINTMIIASYGDVKPIIVQEESSPSIIRNIPKLLQMKTYTIAGIKLIQMEDELTHYILNIKA